VPNVPESPVQEIDFRTGSSLTDSHKASNQMTRGDQVSHLNSNPASAFKKIKNIDFESGPNSNPAFESNPQYNELKIEDYDGFGIRDTQGNNIDFSNVGIEDAIKSLNHSYQIPKFEMEELKPPINFKKSVGQDDLTALRKELMDSFNLDEVESTHTFEG